MLGERGCHDLTICIATVGRDDGVEGSGRYSLSMQETKGSFRDICLHVLGSLENSVQMQRYLAACLPSKPRLEEWKQFSGHGSRQGTSLPA